MAKMSNFNPTSISKVKKYTKTIQRFLGVDYSSQKFLVGDGRAIDLLNYIYKDGVIQKRLGFEELFQIKPFNYVPKDFDGNDVLEVHTNTINFNGIWRLRFEDGLFHTIAHIGKLLYEVVNLEDGKPSFEPILYSPTQVTVEGQNYYQCYEYEDFKSFAFNGGDRLWFLGGNKFMLIRYLENDGLLVVPVEDSQFAPIPVTQISITYKNARAGQRANLDNVNLLNVLRKNRLISGIGKDEDEKTKSDFYDYTLDAPLICKNEARDMANFSIQIKERGKIE